MAIALDTTAHPANAGNLLTNQDGAGAHVWQTITSPAFSTGSGPVVIRAHVSADGSAIPFGGSAAVAWVGGTPAGWSAFTIWKDETDAGKDFGVQVWTAFSASTAASAQSVAFTANTSSSNQSGSLWLLVENGVATTEAACRGSAAAGYNDDVGVNNTVAASITPDATGSSLAGIYLNTNIHTALTANAQTSAFDAHHEFTGSDAVAFGRYKVSGAVTLSTAGVAKSLGCTDVDQFTAVAVTEIKAPSAAGAAFVGGVSGQSSLSAPLSASTNLTGGVASASRLTAPLTTAIRLAGDAHGAEAVNGGLGPAVFPLSVVVVVSTTQLFTASPAPTWAVREGSPGGSISAGTGGNATYTAPATPGTYHVTATVSGAVTTAIVTVVAAPTNPTIRLDSPLQLMDGFGVSQGDSEPALITDALADLLYSTTAGCGFSIFRCGINPDGTGVRHDPGDYATFAWDLWGHVHKALLRNPAMRIVAAPWTPPNAFKSNGNPIGGSLNAANYDDWANVLAAFVTLAAAQTPPVPVYAVSAQNEPDFGTGHDSCLYIAAQMRDFVKALGGSLAALPAALRPRLMTPEPSDPTLLEGFLSTLEADATAAGFASIYATHQYGNATMPASTRAARPTWVTEMSGLAGGPEGTWDPTIADGVAIAKWVHSAITQGNVSAWVWWIALAEYHTGALPYVDTDNEALILTDGDLTPSPITQATLTKRLYTLGNFARFVRPGYQRVGIVGSLPANVSASAYRDPDTGRLVIVCINDSASSSSLSLDVGGGAAPVALTPWVTSGTAIGSIGTSGNLEQQTPIPLSGVTLTATLAAHSVTTFASGAAFAGNVSGAEFLTAPMTTAIQLSGGVGERSALSSALLTAINLAGNIGGRSALSSALANTGALSGGTSGQGALSGALAAAVLLAAGASGASSPSGQLSTAIPFAAQLAGMATLTGGLSTAVQLQAALVGRSAMQGALQAAIRLAGGIFGTSSMSGSLSGGSAPVQLARGVPLKGQPTAFATLKGQSAVYPVLLGQGDS